jgi:hypothetical protein
MAVGCSAWLKRTLCCVNKQSSKETRCCCLQLLHPAGVKVSTVPRRLPPQATDHTALCKWLLRTIASHLPPAASHLPQVSASSGQAVQALFSGLLARLLGSLPGVPQELAAAAALAASEARAEVPEDVRCAV